MRRRALAAAIAAVTILQLAFLVAAMPLSALISRDAAEVRLKVEGIDPIDVFKGRYLALSVSAAEAPVGELPSLADKTPEQLREMEDETVYCLLEQSREGGLSKLLDVSEKKPAAGTRYLGGCRVRFPESDDKIIVARVTFPLERYYLQEDLAPEAERVIRDGKAKSSLVIALGSDGAYVVDSLEIDGMPIERFARKKTAER